MNLKQLDHELEEALVAYNEQIEFMLNTFDQSHHDDKLTKDDMEEMGRQTFYAMGQFKSSLMKYLKEDNR